MYINKHNLLKYDFIFIFFIFLFVLSNCRYLRFQHGCKHWDHGINRIDYEQCCSKFVGRLLLSSVTQSLHTETVTLEMCITTRHDKKFSSLTLTGLAFVRTLRSFQSRDFCTTPHAEHTDTTNQ
jgi:hypothetical protein